SAVGPTAELLLATLAIEPSHPLIGPLFESVVTRGRTTPWWNTQDFAAAVRATDAWQRRFPPASLPGLRIRANGKQVFATAAGRLAGDSTVSLAALLGGRPVGPIAIDVETIGGSGA